MTQQIIDLGAWPRAAQYRFFRTYQQPHYATTTRLDVTHLMSRKTDGTSAYRACLYAIDVGLHQVPELCMRFRGNQVAAHDMITLSMTVPTDKGGLDANTGERDDLAYLSCMPWQDYTSINNALPEPDDCIPRITWEKFVERDGVWEMAMTLEVHYALVDGAQMRAYFAAVRCGTGRASRDLGQRLKCGKRCLRDCIRFPTVSGDRGPSCRIGTGSSS
jgi:chloramphenicol O-acetyltransferase type A